MYGNAKNIENYLVKSETLLYFVMPNKRNCADSIHVVDTFWAYPRSTSASRSCACLATMGDTSSLYIYLTKLLTNKCQTRSKVSTRSTVRSLRLVPTVRNRRPSTNSRKPSLSSSLTGAYQNHSRRTASTVVPSPCLASGAMMSLKATTHRCTTCRPSSTRCKTSTDENNPPRP